MIRLVKRFSAPLLFFCVAVLALIVSVFSPFHNWDMIGYIAAAKAFEEQDVGALHSFTYEQLRNSVSEAEYQMLAPPKGIDYRHVISTDSTLTKILGVFRILAYRHVISTDSTAFAEQLPFYQIRPVYTGLIYLLYKTGINIGFATHFISGIAVFAALIILYPLSKSSLTKSFVYAMPLMAIVFDALDVARYSTPDGLAFCAIILSGYLFLKKHIALLMVFLPIMVGIRTDLILFTLPVYCGVYALYMTRTWEIVLSVLASIVVYFGIVTYWSNPGWSTTFYFTLVDILTHPISMPPTLGVKDYFHVLVKGTISLTKNSEFVLYILMAAYSLYLIKNRAKMSSVIVAFTAPTSVLAVICLAYVGSHFLAFPVAWNRFFAAPYLLGAYSLLSMITDYLRESKPAHPLS